MREIKFRAWDKKQKKFWHDFRLHPFGNVYPANNTSFFDGTEYWVYDNKYPQKHIVLLQYTGLKDKNGVEIYEGDIVVGGVWDWKKPKKMLVEFDVDEFGYMPFTEQHDTCEGRYRIYPDTSEVIGNIYETPELLK